jgi:hypothetical protein
MKYFSYMICLVLALITTGCFEMLEDIYVNKDGTGRYELTVDMSSMLSDPFMGEMMKNGMKEETGREQLEIDSLISFADMQEGGLPASLTDQDRAIIDRTQMRMIMSESEQVGKFIITFPFQSMSELNQFQKTFDKLNEEGGEQSGMGGLLSGSAMTSSQSIWDLSGRKLSRVVDPANVASMTEDMDEETLSMMKMMMAEASFTTTYYLPGEVKKTTINDATVDGNTVSVTYEFLDMLEEQPDMGGTIKFKN